MLFSGRWLAFAHRPWAQYQKVDFFGGGGVGVEELVLNLMILLCIACRLLGKCFQ